MKLRAMQNSCSSPLDRSEMPTIESYVGNTPLVILQRLPGQTSNLLFAKLEGNNPAGSVKDRPAVSMIKHAQARGDIKPGDTLIEATSGNTGIALAMAAAIRGYHMILIMPENMSVERRAVMKAFGAEIILTPADASIEASIDLSHKMQAEGKGKVLDQFSNPDNPRAHYEATAPEIWRDTQGKITHFVSSMGTTGTIMGVSRYLKEKNPDIQIVGVQPTDEAKIECDCTAVSVNQAHNLAYSHEDGVRNGRIATVLSRFSADRLSQPGSVE